MATVSVNTIQEKWEFFEREVLCDVGPDKRGLAKIAFYSGASTILRIQVEAAKFSDDAWVAIFDGLHDEVHEFIRNLR